MKYAIRCNKVENGKNGVIGMASIVIEDKLVINNIRLVKKDESRYVQFPSRKSDLSESGYSLIAYPQEKGLSTNIKKAVLKSYNASGEEQTIQTEAEFKLSVKVNPYDREDISLKGFTDVSLCGNDEFRIKDITLREGKNGVFMAMPSYQKKDGTYANIIHPATKEFFEELNSAVMEQYSQKQYGKSQRESIKDSSRTEVSAKTKQNETKVSKRSSSR